MGKAANWESWQVYVNTSNKKNIKTRQFQEHQVLKELSVLTFNIDRLEVSSLSVTTSAVIKISYNFAHFFGPKFFTQP